MDPMALLQEKDGKSVQGYTTKFGNIVIMLGNSPKNPNVLLKHLGGLHHHLREQIMLFKLKLVDKDYVRAQHQEKIGLKRAQLSGSKQKEKHEYFEGKKKKKGKG